ncbi:MAG: signal peptidase II [Planctomycetia bacterium]|nr:signal peptidase II [Planctomycetia bacterium]
MKTYPSFKWLVTFFLIAALGFLADWTSKNYFSGTLSDEERQNAIIVRTDIIPPVFSLLKNSPLNKGALFSLGNQWGLTANAVFITISSLAILGIVGWALWPHNHRNSLYTIVLALILSGALGNCMDRLFYGGVRDWIWVYYQRGENDYPFNWPVFNLADCFLVGGAIMLLLHGLLWPAPVKSVGTPETKTAQPA